MLKYNVLLNHTLINSALYIIIPNNYVPFIRIYANKGLFLLRNNYFQLIDFIFQDPSSGPQDGSRPGNHPAALS